MDELLEENARLRQRIKELEEEKKNAGKYFGPDSTNFTLERLPSLDKLAKDTVERYSRQLLMHEIAVKGIVHRSILHWRFNQSL
jgi:hypothetical protein